MEFRVFFPPIASAGGEAGPAAPPPVPALIFLSGLTCTPANASEKAGAARMAAACGLALVFPDTSPRGLGVPGEDESYDLGTGAGFYVDATQAPWVRQTVGEGGGQTGYRMFSYITEDLVAALAALALDTDRLAITGHSMGGHGALVAALKRPDLFKSVSALSPIARPAACPWGVKAFGAYLGGDTSAWLAWDACALIRAYAGPARRVLVDVGGDDEFLSEQLQCGQLVEAAAGRVDDIRADDIVSADVRVHAGYDHSYFFIATVVDEHVKFHAAALGLVDADDDGGGGTGA
jgi:S-formylglutathione hydrolase